MENSKYLKKIAQLKAMKERAVKKYQDKRRAKISSGLVEVSPGKYTLKMTRKHPLKRRLRRERAVPLPKLKRKLWALISQDTRKRETQCVSCGRLGSQAGHYIKKSICNLIYQYLKANIHTQCVRCNVFLHGNPVEYRKWMIKTYGAVEVEAMERSYNLQLPLGFNPREFIEGELQKYGDNKQDKSN